MNPIKFDFLSFTFSLLRGTFRPYKEPNNNLSYINVLSNHPPNIVEHLPNSRNDFSVKKLLQ